MSAAAAATQQHDKAALREAASAVRAMNACCMRPLPPSSVVRLVAWELRGEVAEVLRTRDSKRLASLGLARDSISAMFRSFPDTQSTDALATAWRCLVAGLPPRLVTPALKAFESDAADRLARDPYGAVCDIRGTLEDADAMAANWGAADRIAGHARWFLRHAARDGHTSMPTLDLLRKIIRGGEGVREALAMAVQAGKLALVGPPDADECIADPEAFRDEFKIATDIKKRIGSQAVVDTHAMDLDDLTPDQKAAIRLVCASRIGILTGGPGTGKSHAIRALVRAVGEGRCMLTAPTGRAARNVKGSTVHSASGGRLLKRRPIQETSKADVPSDVALLIVDEASMLTTELMIGVLSLAPETCCIILVGDSDQLPPIGPGNVLRDLMTCGRVPVATLTHNHRCPTHVEQLARAVLRGQVPDSLDIVDAAGSGDVLRETLKAAVATGGQILSPQNAGRQHLNRAMQSVARPVSVVNTTYAFFEKGDHAVLSTDAQGQTTLRCGAREVCMPVDHALAITQGDSMVRGDLVMVLKNQNKKRLADGVISACNGDIGTYMGDGKVDFGDGIAEFPVSAAGGGGGGGWLTLAYAATVHKFQGSECECVVLPLDSSWDRHLLYTAVTRAKSKVVLVGTRESLKLIVGRTRAMRHSILAKLL